MMNRLRTYLLYLLVPLVFSGCAKDDGDAPFPVVSRTLLVYMAGDNNLASNGYANLSSITAAMTGYAASDARVVVYIDTPGENPRLIEATASGQKVLHTWPSAQNSASGGTLTEVIGLTRRLVPAETCGLVLWSHGVGWLPSSAMGYLTRSMGRIAGQTDGEPGPWPATKWFGQDVSASPTGYIDTDELAVAIPSGVFDYILFDACHMASVEVLYALRDKADYIISSPAEVIADGFPYATVTRMLLQASPDLQAVCRSYYNYYAGHSDPSYRSATVSLVKCAELDALADATAMLYGAALQADPAVFSAMELTRLQPFDRYRRHFLFDLGSIADELERGGTVTAAQATAWRAQLARTVVWEAHTGAFFDLPLAKCCGLSGYVPVETYADLNTYYQTLGWWKQCSPSE